MKFKIGNIKLEHDDLHNWAQEKMEERAPEWIKAIAKSVNEWFDKNDHIEIMTSGSTGEPKRINLSKESMIASARLTGRRFGLMAGMTSLNCLPSQYVAGKMMIIRALVLNLNQICIEPKLSLKVDQDDTILDFIAMTPLQLEKTLDENPELIHSANTIILGGAPISRRLDKRILNIKSHCHATYGMTETITHIATRPVNGADRTDIFKAIEGVHFSSHKGCLVIHAEHLLHCPIFTTDQIELIDSHHFQWLGRQDNVINSGGVKIHPERIEQQLEIYIQDRFFIGGLRDTSSGERPALVIESKKYDDQNLKLLKSQLLHLPKIQRPVEIIFISKFLETPTGKVKRNISLYSSNKT